MEPLLEYLLVFCLCASVGWCIEVVYRAVRHRKVVNPGFMTGCCLPIYGIGGTILYFLSGLKLRVMPNEFWRVAAILFAAVLVMTLIELIGGLISARCFHVQLWDYSGEWLNFKGVICPKFSLFWALICAAYYFLLYRPLHALAIRVIELPWLILLIGAYVGVFTVDLIHSLHVMQRLKAYALTMRMRLNLDQIKANAREYFRRESGKKHAPFNFYRMINRYVSDMHGYRDRFGRRRGEDENGKKDG